MYSDASKELKWQKSLPSPSLNQYMHTVIFRDLGLTDYKDAWELQEKLFDEVVARKLFNRTATEEEQLPLQHFLLFCEHPHVFTLGKIGRAHV